MQLPGLAPPPKAQAKAETQEPMKLCRPTGKAKKGRLAAH